MLNGNDEGGGNPWVHPSLIFFNMDPEDQATLDLYKEITGADDARTHLTSGEKDAILRRLMVLPHPPTLLAGGPEKYPREKRAAAATGAEGKPPVGQKRANEWAMCQQLLLHTTAIGVFSEPAYERAAFMLYKLDAPKKDAKNDTERNYSFIQLNNLSLVSHQADGSKISDTTVSPYSMSMHALRTRHVVDPATGITYHYPLDIRRVIGKLAPQPKQKKVKKGDAKDVEVEEEEEEEEEEAPAPVLEPAPKKRHRKSRNKKKKSKSKSKGKGKSKSKKEPVESSSSSEEEEDDDDDEDDTPQLIPGPPVQVPEPPLPVLAPPITVPIPSPRANYLTFLRDAESRQQSGGPPMPVLATITKKRSKSTDGTGIITVRSPSVASLAPRDSGHAWTAPFLDQDVVQRTLSNLGAMTLPTAETRIMVESARILARAPHRLAATLIPAAELHRPDNSAPPQLVTLARVLDAVRKVTAAAHQHPLLEPPLV